jgi:hypothetical protein
MQPFVQLSYMERERLVIDAFPYFARTTNSIIRSCKLDYLLDDAMYIIP